jgi:trans-AT polyketide synthase/acyltransferase/oxidoreductase domain-containing protein
MAVWLFPGQGSQERGMGAGLFERYPGLVSVADARLGYSIEELCLTDPEGRLRDTRYVQPALFVVEALAFLDRAEREPRPDFLAGHSLGEYSALFAGGSFDFETGVLLVQRRGEAMAQVSGGGMAAVLGAAATTVGDLLAEGGFDDIDVANDNAPDQVVLSGPRDVLDAVGKEVQRRGGGRWVPLAVSAPFHSRAMIPIAEDFGRFLAEHELRDPTVAVISNVTGEPYAPGSVHELLTEQVKSPVRWAAGMRYLLARGEREIVELGPGTVLSGLWRANRRAFTAPVQPPGPLAARATAPDKRPTAAAELPTATAPAERATAPAESATAESATAESATAGPERMGSAEFRRDYGIRYAYVAGAMYHGIASTDLVIRMGQAGLMGFFGAGGLVLSEIEQALAVLRGALGPEGRYGMNLLCTLDNPELEQSITDLYLRNGVRYVEAAAYPKITAQLVQYRFSGAHRDALGRPVAVNHVLAKVSRPEVAAAFMRPPPEALLTRLVAGHRLSPEEAQAAARLPISDDICVEADSGGHTDGGAALTLVPSILRLRDEVASQCGYPGRIRVGAAGGLGAPEALAAAFVLGADFVVTGSVNQCSPQAGTSEAVKDLLATLDVQDTAYAPAGDMFELGARVQVARKGTLFAARANKLYQVYRQYGSLDEIDDATRTTIERDYFGRSFDEIWKETATYLEERHPQTLARAERDPRRKAALVLRWYFRHTTDAAIRGNADERVNYQIHCGPAMGAFNNWVRGTDLEDWRARHVDVIADRLMTAAAQYLRQRISSLVPEALSGWRRADGGGGAQQ